MTLNENNIILASGSPRRKEILEKYGIKFSIKTSSVDEDFSDELTPAQAAMYIAFKKAMDVSKEIRKMESNNEEKERTFIIGADTIVCSDEIMGKPVDENDGIRMLEKLSGEKHSVITGVCIIDIKNKRTTLVYDSTDVYFKELTIEEIKAYIATGEYKDKAGAYGIQGYGNALVSKYEGDLENVIGFPYKKFEVEMKNIL